MQCWRTGNGQGTSPGGIYDVSASCCVVYPNLLSRTELGGYYV
jgi:hypothetical protein